MESAYITPIILNLDIRWRWVVSFTPRPLYPWGTISRYPFDRRLGGPQIDLNAVAKGIIPALPLTGTEARSSIP